MQELAPYLGPLIAIATLAYTIISNLSKASWTKMEELEKAIDTKAGTVEVAALSARSGLLENRTTAIETDMKHLPNKDQAHRLELSVVEMRSDLRAIAQRVAEIANKLELPPA